MKKILPTLLITTSLALCVLCAIQWIREAKHWQTIEQQDKDIFERDKTLQSYTNQVAIMDRHIAGMETDIDNLKSTVKTNNQQILTLTRDLSRSDYQRTNLMAELEQYKVAFEEATNKLADAYETIKTNVKDANEAIQKVVKERDDYVTRLNESIKDRNDVVKQYNDLVEQVKKQQEAEAAAQGGKKPAPPAK